MLRNHIFHKADQHYFHLRGKELFRVEALSDAVFAFSVSLLVASLEVPQTFAELKIITKGAIPFFMTVALVFLFWYQQNMFFRRYGLNDYATILLNLAYLAVVIFYVYPLKFLFSLLISSWSGLDLFSRANEQGLVVLNKDEFPQLVILFSIGYFLIWFIIYLLHRRVLHFATRFDFTRYELFFTKKEARGAFWNALIGLAALLLAFIHLPVLAGVCYLFIPVVLIYNQHIFKRQCKKQGKLK